jgi:hypothetical protein
MTDIATTPLTACSSRPVPGRHHHDAGKGQRRPQVSWERGWQLGGPFVAKEFISVKLTRDELRLITKAVSQLIYEYEHNVDLPSSRSGIERLRHPDTSEWRRLASRLEQLLR